MPEYAADRVWSDRFIPQINTIVGPLLLTPATYEHDAQENTDLMILAARDMRIAARIRRHGAFQQFGHEVTIRATRTSGARTEFSKLIYGFGDWMFYGHANQQADAIEHWMLLDLAVFRAALIYDSNTARKVVHTTKPNVDGKTTFKAFDMRSFPQSVFIARSADVIVRTEGLA